MKQNRLLFFTMLFLIIPLLNFSQNVKTSKNFKLEVSKPYEVVDAYKRWYFANGDKILTIKYRGDFTFQLFDAATMKEESKVEIEKKSDELPRGFVHEEFLQKGDKILQYYNIWDKKNEIEQIYYRTYDFKNTGKASNEKLLLKVNGKLKSLMGQNKIDLYQSFDKLKTLMVYEKLKESKRDSENFQTFGMIAYDENMKELWNKEVKMPYSEAEITNMGYTLDNAGNAYLLLRKKDKDDKKEEVSMAPIELMRINGEKAVKRINIKANGKNFPKGIKLQEGKDNKVFCAGYYGGQVASQGVYVSIINSNGDVENERFYEIPKELINQNTSDKQQERKEKKEAKGADIGMDHLGLDEIVVNKDGSLVLIGEVFYVMTMPSGSGKIKNSYHYQEMLVTKVDATGNLKWMKKLPKNQYRSESYDMAYGTGFALARMRATKKPSYDLSYKYVHSENEHYFLYLDNVKNLDIPLDKFPAQHVSRAGGFLTAYKVDDASGDVTKLSLFDLKNVKGIPVKQFDTERIFQRNDNELFVEVYKKDKEDIMLRININND